MVTSQPWERGIRSCFLNSSCVKYNYSKSLWIEYPSAVYSVVAQDTVRYASMMPIKACIWVSSDWQHPIWIGFATPTALWSTITISSSKNPKGSYQDSEAAALRGSSASVWAFAGLLHLKVSQKRCHCTSFSRACLFPKSHRKRAAAALLHSEHAHWPGVTIFKIQDLTPYFHVIDTLSSQFGTRFNSFSLRFSVRSWIWKKSVIDMTWKRNSFWWK